MSLEYDNMISCAKVVLVSVLCSRCSNFAVFLLFPHGLCYGMLWTLTIFILFYFIFSDFIWILFFFSFLFLLDDGEAHDMEVT